jgi:regulator of replication initiation timing
VLFLAQETRQNRADIKDLQNEVEKLTGAMQRLAYEIQRNKENEAHEREKIYLKLENEVLRRLLAAKSSEEQKGQE